MKRLGSYLGIDKTIVLTIMARGWSAAAGLATIPLISLFLSPALQGYYYTFCSFVTFQVLAELGLTTTVLQFTSHEMARLTWTADGLIVGDERSKKRLQSLVFFAFKCLRILVPLTTTLFAALGIMTFRWIEPRDVSGVMVTIPWLLLVVCTAFGMFLSVFVSILEGSGRNVEVASLRLWQSIAAVVVTWLVLSCGGGLFSLAASSLVVVSIGFFWLYLKFKIAIKDIYFFKSDLAGMHWRHEIWPFQWRMALSGVSGFFIFQSFNPILFVTQGPVAAGQMGMTVQIVGAMNGFAISWIATKLPAYGKLVAAGNYFALDKMFFRGFLQSMALLLICSSGVLIAVYWLASTHHPYIGRILPMHLFGVLLLSGLASHILAAEAAYLRAHKREPFMLLSVVLGVTTPLAAIVLVPEFGLIGATLSYALPTLLLGLPTGTAIFLRFRKSHVL